MKKIVYKLVALLCIICITGTGLTACGNKNESQVRTIVDCVGDKVECPAEINKVICVSQNAMEFMVAMGLEDHLVGIHKSVFYHTWSKEYISNLDKLKGFGYSPTAEAVYESEADLVIVKDASTARELREAGVTAITFSYGNDEELIFAVELLGEIFGEKAQEYSDKWISYYKETVSEIEKTISKLDDTEKRKVYFIDASVAIDAGGLCTTVGGSSIVEQWFDNIGAILVTKEYDNIDSINEEAILQINPEAIMIGGWSENTRKEQLLADTKWKNIEAVKNGDIYLTPVGFTSFERYGVEAPLLLKYSAQQIYPKLFDYDVVNDFQAFFDEFYGIQVSEEKINYMLKGLSPDGSRMD